MTNLEYIVQKPTPALADFVESFWMLTNHSTEGKEIIILPDGRVDIFFSKSATQPFHVTLMGIDGQADQTIFAGKTIIYAVSLKLLAVEYLFDSRTHDLRNKAQMLPTNFWDFNENDLNDFEAFCKKVSAIIEASIAKKSIDNRKQKLFELIYASNGAMTIKALAEQSFWSSRQINRYFHDHFGITLKAYCNILRFRASFKHIKEGKLFPEQNFADQAHFIKEVKKLSGVVPKELSKNKNDRFIQFSLLPPK